MLEPRLKLVTPIEVDKCALEELLSTQEILIFQRLKSERRKRDWLAGRLAAKELLRAHLAQAKEQVPWTIIELYSHTTGGPCFRVLHAKPELQTLSQALNISIAHSHGHGLCGLARTPEEGYIGVDLEEIRPLSAAVQKRFLIEAELKQIERQLTGRESEGALLFWVLKEAAFKALRLSTFGKLTRLQVSEFGDGSAVIVYRPNEDAQEIAISAFYRRHADFFLAWALLSPPANRTLRTHSRCRCSSRW